LADGVYRINGAYNSLAIEFSNQIVLFEAGPQSEARLQAINAEAKHVIPNNPVRYSVISHHHFDQACGLRGQFNLPPANDPVPNPPVIGTTVFVDNIERLHLEPERVISIHSLNPDRLTTVAEIKASLGRK
jgi:glyoxylase-like metal-dependent hydrolase (beta-lactamase superfamily II)